MQIEITQESLDMIRRMAMKSPELIKDEVGKFFVRGLAVLRGTIMNNPWRIGMSGGGAPVNTGNLRDTHKQSISTWEARIGPNQEAARYAGDVHGTRPWLDYAVAKTERDIEKLEDNLLKDIIKRF